MSNRNTDNTFIYAILAILVLVAAGSLAWSELSDQAPHPVSNNYETSRYAQSAESRVKSLCVGMSGSDLAHCIIEIEQSERENHRAQKDLKAQRYMAIWGFVMAASGIFTVGITGAGLYWIRRTFMETQRAVDAAEGATEAAIASVAVTKQIGTKQIRAYVAVMIDGVLDFQVGKRPKARMRFRNAGQTPALNFRSNSGISIVDAEFVNEAILGATGIPNETVGDSTSVIPPGVQIPIESQMLMDLSQNDIIRLERRECHLLISGKLVYEDVFGVEQFTSFSALLNAEGYLMGGARIDEGIVEQNWFFTPPIGNEAS